jgi:uncharacterized protein
MRPTVDEIRSVLVLEPHPTCGFTALSYLSPHRIANEALPAGYRGTHTLGLALYFLVTPEQPTRLHRIRSDQIYHHYLGDPLEVLMLLPDGKGAVATVGGDLAAGMRPQLLIPGGLAHLARPGGRQLCAARHHRMAELRPDRSRDRRRAGAHAGLP